MRIDPQVHSFMVDVLEALNRMKKMLMRPKRIMCFIPYIFHKYIFAWHELYRYETYRDLYEIHPTFRFGGIHILLYGPGRIILEENSYIGNYSTIFSDEGCIVRIGSGCAISHNVRIYSQTYIADQEFGRERDLRKASVTIGNNVWIGASVFINPGITIGEDSIVGANSMVTHDIEPGSIVGGVPARPIRKKSTFNSSRQ
jgi:maltose O-acetyltransferase